MKTFENIHVLDLSSVLAGPLCGTFFAELGAKVVKIENKNTEGDATRQWKLANEQKQSAYSSYYFSANYGKEIRLLDFENDTELEEVKQLICKSDIVLSNFQKKVGEKFGLTPDHIKAIHPSVIVVQLSAYSYDDPRPGYDLVMQAETGWLSMTGTDANHLAKLPVALIDIIASHQMREAALIGLIRKATYGTGGIYHVSLYKSALSALANQASGYLNVGSVPSPIGTLHPNIAPYGDLFTSKDGYSFILAVGSDFQFKKLWYTLNLDEESYHIFEKNFQRVTLRKDLQSILQSAFNHLFLSEIIVFLQNEGIPMAQISDLRQVFAQNRLASEMINHRIIDEKQISTISTISFYMEV